MEQVEVEKTAIMINIQLRRNEYVFKNHLRPPDRITLTTTVKLEDFQMAMPQSSPNPFGNPKTATKWTALANFSVKVNWDCDKGQQR